MDGRAIAGDDGVAEAGLIPVAYNVRSLAARRSTTIASAMGIALVVFVFAAVLMLANGVEQTMRATGSPARRRATAS